MPTRPPHTDDAQLEAKGGADVLAADIISTAHDRDLEPPPEPAPLGMGAPTVGARCVAVLSEDDDWHPAVVTDVLGDDEFRVTFTEYSKPQTVRLDQLVLEEDIVDGDERKDACPMCERMMPLTRHHLIPRMMHEKYLKTGLTQDFLNTCLDICRQCHSAVHRAEDEATLAEKFNTLELILTHPGVQKWSASWRRCVALCVVLCVRNIFFVYVHLVLLLVCICVPCCVWGAPLQLCTPESCQSWARPEHRACRRSCCATCRRSDESICFVIVPVTWL